ncbi:MAG: hypothetical protein JWQ73_2496 [Variovorax sp.]|jgi:hypothetical protein|nr:hypothetical protein [Variovorax sp.]
MHVDFIKEVISREARGGSDARQVADAVTASMRLLHAELSKVVGEVAANALGAHAVHRTRSNFNWAMSPAGSVSADMLSSLKQDLARRKPADSQHAGETLIFALVDHLVGLIGEQLTYRILRSAWGKPSAEPASMEIL